MSIRSNGHVQDHNATVGEEPTTTWRSADKIKAKRQHWLFPGRITASGITLVEGATHAGKSTFLSHLVASITTGKPWLNRPKSTPANVLWLSGEEDFGSMIVPRLRAAGVDLTRVKTAELDEYDEPIRYVLPHCVGTFRRAVPGQQLAAIIMEPLSSFVSPDADMNSVASVRGVLDPLQRMSFAVGCAVILTRGLRKDRNGPRASHGQGSSAIGDTARNALQIDCADPTKSPRVLVSWKVMGGKLPSPVAYEIAETESGPQMKNLRELNPTESIESDCTVDAGARTERADARDMLRVMLKAGWLRVKVLFLAAADAGISLATLRKAGADLGVVRRQKWENEINLWEWGPPPGGFVNQPPPPRKSGNQGIRVKRAGKRPGKGDTLIP